MLVDQVSDHPYKAGLLVNSLIHFGGVSTDQIHVHCTSRVETRFVAYFASMGCHTHIVQPYLDGKYSNKIRQTGSLKDFNAPPDAGFCLLDVDTFVLEPFRVADQTAIWGKTVDGNNPPLDDLKKIFDAAGLKHPDICTCDWGSESTFRTNYNGGVLFVPTAAMAPLDEKWRKWAEFLFSRPELITKPQQRIHIDQISFCLALADIHIPSRNLNANSNYPGHSNKVPISFDPSNQISVLHYHWCMDRFGFLEHTDKNPPALSAAIQKANKSIESFHMPELFEEMKTGAGKKFAVMRTKNQSELPGSITNRLKEYDPAKRFILHGGTPKTGTSSLQRELGGRRTQLSEQGIWYPPPSNTPEPKHQQFVGALQKKDPRALSDWLVSVFDECPENCHTVFITSEGMYNHWWDHSADGLTVLSSFMNYFRGELWFVLREPVSFAKSLYLQYLKNPPVNGPMKGVYGVDQNFLRMCQSDWFSAHFDYLEFYHSCSQIFGAEKLKLFGYETNISQRLIEKLVGETYQSPARRNVSLGVTTVEMLRRLNRLELKAEDKALAVERLTEIDAIIRNHDGAFQFSKDEAAYIGSRTELSWQLIQPKLQPLEVG